jgi:hypothetical protein
MQTEFSLFFSQNGAIILNEMQCAEYGHSYKEKRSGCEQDIPSSLRPFGTIKRGDMKLNYIINSNMHFMSKSNFPSDSSYESKRGGGGMIQTKAHIHTMILFN